MFVIKFYALRLKLILFLADLLPVTLACQCFLHTLLLARLQVKRVTLYFLDDVLGLHFALEAAQRILKRLTFLYSNFCQWKYTSKLAHVASNILRVTQAFYHNQNVCDHYFNPIAQKTYLVAGQNVSSSYIRHEDSPKATHKSQ